jgi:hypothetical protein
MSDPALFWSSGDSSACCCCYCRRYRGFSSAGAGYGCSGKFSSRIVIRGGVSTCNADHVIQSQFVFVDQASQLVPEQSSPL